jgi:Flp pilus assembly protein TadB
MARKISFPGLLLGVLTGLLVGLLASHLVVWFLFVMIVALVVLGWRMRRKTHKRSLARAA